MKQRSIENDSSINADYESRPSNYEEAKRSKTSKTYKRLYTNINPSDFLLMPKDEDVNQFKELFKKGNEYLNYFWQSSYTSTNSKMHYAINSGKINSNGIQLVNNPI